MAKTRTYPKHYIYSSKHSSAKAGKAFTLFILKQIAQGLEVAFPEHCTPKQKSRKFYDLHEQGLIKQTSDGLSITSKGQRLLTEEYIWSLTIHTPKVWDEHWHMVLYDIPIKKARQRHAFRARLEELGLVLYQNSVWIHPYPLEETIHAIAEFYKLEDCVLFAVAERLNGEKKLKQLFKL